MMAGSTPAPLSFVERLGSSAPLSLVEENFHVHFFRESCSGECVLFLHQGFSSVSARNTLEARAPRADSARSPRTQMAEESGEGRSSLPRSLQGELLRHSPREDEDDWRAERAADRRSPYVLPPFPPPPPASSSSLTLAALGGDGGTPPGDQGGRTRDESYSLQPSRRSPQPRPHVWPQSGSYGFPPGVARTDPSLYTSTSRAHMYTYPPPPPPPRSGLQPPREREAAGPSSYYGATEEEHTSRPVYMPDVGGPSQYTRGTPSIPMPSFHELSPPRVRQMTPRLMTPRPFTPSYTTRCMFLLFSPVSFATNVRLLLQLASNLRRVRVRRSGRPLRTNYRRSSRPPSRTSGATESSTGPAVG
ncbi:hypothetical protein OBBRIDRAFT_792498 [Obba rivulosa]|uniref:Uncharacterized protein n=1 Tax=Obba rivulosa TaxID=1052685 RepID=A0A8E2AUG2_9APHY|nr:hypothetical protein OBBRIDRAFT_792498 [Obba rivulosa]